MRRAAGLILLVLVVYTLGVLQGRMWINRGGETAPPSMQTPVMEYQDPLCAALRNHPDEVVRRRACEK
jgi:hypothetical protein